MKNDLKESRNSEEIEDKISIKSDPDNTEPTDVELNRENDEVESAKSGLDNTETTDAESNKEKDEAESAISALESLKTTNTFSNPISLLQPKIKPSLATSGFMFKPKVSNSAPVTTFAVSKAESSGQFKFDGTSNEINTNFKPFSDNPDA